jgi:molybdopterin/thiamine biosynthesis adenylyltransferase
MVEAAMNEMEGQLSVILPPDTPCLQCTVPEVPNWWRPLGFGVLGALSGTVGSMAAIEAVKILTGFGTVLAGTMLVLDGEDMSFSKFALSKRADCPVCGGSA